jgi:hypothetical protein
MTEHCDHCKKTRRIGWKVNDIIWAMVVPPKFFSKKLCLNCFLYFAETRQVKLKRADMEWLFFAGIVWVDK